jgi:competence protein ComGC
MKNSQSSLPKIAIDSGTMIVGIIITFVIVVISLVLIMVELAKWKEFQMDMGSTSLVKTIVKTSITKY